MKNNLLKLTIILSMLLLALVPMWANAASYTDGDLTYTISNDEIEIIECTQSATLVEIPAEIDNYPVTSIGASAFSGCTSITTITIPKSVTNIASNSFTFCPITTVNYEGTKAEWNSIEGINKLYSATKIYNFVVPSPSASAEKSDNQFVVTPSNVPVGSRIILVCYNDEKMVYMSANTYIDQKTIIFTPDKEYDNVKIMIWEDLNVCIPLCAAKNDILN